MKKGMSILLIAVILLSLCGCGDTTATDSTNTKDTNYQELIIGRWHPEGGGNDYIFYDDGTFENDDDYGSWAIVNGTILKMEQETYPAPVYTGEIITLTSSELCIDWRGNEITYIKSDY